MRRCQPEHCAFSGAEEAFKVCCCGFPVDRRGLLFELIDDPLDIDVRALTFPRIELSQSFLEMYEVRLSFLLDVPIEVVPVAPFEVRLA